MKEPFNFDKICHILEESTRWGCNNQPELNDTAKALYLLKITELVVDKDAIEFETFYDPPIDIAFDVIMALTPDEFNRIGPNCYRIWWD